MPTTVERNIVQTNTRVGFVYQTKLEEAVHLAIKSLKSEDSGWWGAGNAKENASISKINCMLGKRVKMEDIS